MTPTLRALLTESRLYVASDPAERDGGKAFRLLARIDAELASPDTGEGLGLRWDGSVLLYGPFQVAKVYRLADGWDGFMLDTVRLDVIRGVGEPQARAAVEARARTLLGSPATALRVKPEDVEVLRKLKADALGAVLIGTNQSEAIDRILAALKSPAPAPAVVPETPMWWPLVANKRIGPHFMGAVTHGLYCCESCRMIVCTEAVPAPVPDALPLMTHCLGCNGTGETERGSVCDDCGGSGRTNCLLSPVPVVLMLKAIDAKYPGGGSDGYSRNWTAGERGIGIATSGEQFVVRRYMSDCAMTKWAAVTMMTALDREMEWLRGETVPSAKPAPGCEHCTEEQIQKEMFRPGAPAEANPDGREAVHVGRKSKGWIGFDLDGTLAEYGGWKGPQHIGAPIPGTIQLVKRYLAAGREVRIFTARVDGGKAALSVGVKEGAQYADVAAIRAVIERWCAEHIGVVLPITNIKDYGMDLLFDDRAVRIVRNTGIACCPQHQHDDHYGLAAPSRVEPSPPIRTKDVEQVVLDVMRRVLNRVPCDDGEAELIGSMLRAIDAIGRK